MVWKSNKCNLMKNVHIHFINIEFRIVFIVVQIIHLGNTRQTILREKRACLKVICEK